MNSPDTLFSASMRRPRRYPDFSDDYGSYAGEEDDPWPAYRACTHLPAASENVRVTDKKTARENPAVQAAVNAVAETLGDDGRILVRESGTEPVIRVMVEATTDELCEKYVDQVIDVIRAEGLVVG